jgi:hypothetical protein
MGLRPPVVLEQGFRTGQAFGTHGTPSALLVDAPGRVASELAVGASSRAGADRRPCPGYRDHPRLKSNAHEQRVLLGRAGWIG